MSTFSKDGKWWSAYALGALTLALVGLGAWALRPVPAYAQIPDSGAQRLEMITELRTSNQKLTEILGVLREIRDLQAGPKEKKETKPPAQTP